MKKNYHIFTPRCYAAIYLFAEFGAARANILLQKLPKDSRGWVDLGQTPFFAARIKRDSNAHVVRICTMIAHHEGRLGRHLTGGGGCINTSEG